MTTNEERREVAAMLRDRKPKSCMHNVLGWGYVCEDVECCEDCNALAMSRLADLIEPKPERTCQRMFFPGVGLICSECGCSTGRASDSYCPNCGAKVVNE